MKSTFRISGFIILIIFMTLCLTSCKKDPVPPVVTTSGVSAITQTTATSGGNVTGDGGAEVTARGVCWNTSENPTVSNSKTSDGAGIGTFNSSLTQLTPGTKYYVRAYATNEAGTGYGSQQSFNTGEILLATVTTADITSPTQTSAVSGGNVTSDGGGAVTARGVCWSTNQNPTVADNKTTDGSGTGSFASNITGLAAGTTYYVRAYATNSAGIAYGNEITLTTYQIKLATLTTLLDYNSITSSTALSGGIITDDGGGTISSKGVCWSEAPNPTYGVFKQCTTDGSGSDPFTSNLAGYFLYPNRTYYIRAYAFNEAGIGYGNELSFTTLKPIGNIIFNSALTYGSVSDNDGNIYKTIQIGSQIWIAENLKTTKLNDGTAIPLVTDMTTWSGLTTSACCWWGNDALTYKANYGALYNWFAVNSGKLCPTGWHVPTDPEWNALMTYLGGEATAGGKLKETGLIHWIYPNDANNESGFTGLPGGYRIGYMGPFGSDTHIGIWGLWWSSTSGTSDQATSWIASPQASLTNTQHDKKNGLSVRCVKD